jgi:CheY-like chemotaxis protein
MRRLKLLVAARIGSDRDLIRGFLRSDDYCLVFAMTGEEALDLLRYQPGFDLVITDVSLQGPGSADISDAIRSINPFIPIVGITAFPIDWVLKQNGGTGVDAWLFKPFSREDMESAVWKCLTMVA